jgi:hypothetical protein
LNHESYSISHCHAVAQTYSKDPIKWKQNNLKAVQKLHSKYPAKWKQNNLIAVQKLHSKDPAMWNQNNLIAVQKLHSKDPVKWKQDNHSAVQKHRQKTLFPPCPLSKQLQHKIINDFCVDTSPEMFMESGCAICGCLTPLIKLQKLSDLSLNLDILKNREVTQRECL